MDEVKHFYTDLINMPVKDDKEKLHVFDENGLYLATKKIGKSNPKAEQIRTDNEYRMRWNRECGGNRDTTDKKRAYLQSYQGIR